MDDHPVALAPLRPSPPGAARLPWHARLREALSAYLPLLLMAMLALGTWWLVENAPRERERPPERPVSNEPDYTMERFSLQRYGPDGRLRVQIDGERLRHYPATDTVEIDEARIRAVSAEGLVTHATARQAVGKGDGSEVRLMGGAEVIRDASPGRERVEFRSEFLHAFIDAERVVTDQPVHIVHGTSDIRAAGLAYDHATQLLQLQGPMRAVLMPRARSRR